MTTKTLTKFKNRVLTLVLTIVALMVGLSAWAQNFTVNASYSDVTKKTTFTIKRSDKTFAQKVLYRTVGLTAYDGQHFTAVSGELNFPADEDTRTVEVEEKMPTTDAYKYQSGSTERSYKLEVTDRAGFILASAVRTMTNGTSFSAAKVSNSITNLVYFNNGNYASGMSSSKYVDVSYTPPTDSVYSGSGVLKGYVLIDDSYDYKRKWATVSTSSLINSTGATASYLQSIGYEIYATVCFTEQERDDGYQYVQIVAGNASHSFDGADPNGQVNNPNNSVYKACFELSTGSKQGQGKVFFPHRYDSETGEFSTDGKLWQQKFRTGFQADNSGSIVLRADVSNITTRFDAGGNDDDTWGYKNFFVRMALCDATAPTKLAVSVAPGRHSRGNTVYVSVAFSEIVTVSGTPKLTSNWGDLSYVAGSGTNVLTFSTTIPQDATGDLNITGFSGTIQDLAGNSLSGGVTASSICTLDNDFAYTIDEFQKDGDNYLIKTHEDLIGLAGYVNGGGTTEDKTFLQVADITFAHTTNWNNANSTENNYTAIGTFNNPFLGTFDGQGYTVSGIRIYRGGTSNSDDYYQGLFGVVKKDGTVKRVTLSDARITGYHEVGGIAAHTFYSSIEDCTVDANVCIHAVQSNAYDHGGIVGSNQAGPVNRCISRATLTVANSSGCKDFGGIVGLNKSNIITDCIAEGVVIPDVNARGAIVGFKEDYYGSTLTRNYYHGCKVASDNVTPSGVGMGTESSKTTSDVDGASALWAVTLPTHASVVRTGTALPGTDNATYDNGADINGVPYAKGASVVNLSYDPATITEGYDVLLSVKQTSDNTAVAFTDNGNHTYTIASMPAADITVSVTEIPIIAYIDADGNPQSHACTPIVEGTTSYQTPGRTEGWYVVNSDVTINMNVKFLDKAVHIILCDGAKFSINSGTFSSLGVPNGSLEILAQSNGSGELYLCSSGSSALEVEMNKNRCIDIHGGNIKIHDGTHGIFAVGGTVTIRRGTVSISGRSDGIKASNIILGCSNVNDRIYVKSYDGTVTIADGQILSDGTDTYSGTLSSEQKTAIAGKTLSAAIPYIDADGTTKYKASKDLTFITTSTQTYGNAANAEGWYCVNSDVNFTNNVYFNDQMVHIILCDGATMSGEKYLNTPHSVIAVDNGSLAIYGQTHGTGTLSLNCTASGSAILANSNIDINGGTINASSPKGIGIKANNAITIRRGNITAKGNEYGIMATTITLGCATTADRIYATGYKGTVTIADGQTLTDGYSANTYANTLTDEQKNAIKKKTMMKALGDVSYIDENGQEQICNNYKILSDGILEYSHAHGYIGTTEEDTWYVASGNYTFNASYLQTYGHVHIILCDGASFTVNGSGSYGIHATGNLSIYGQSQDTGTLTVNVADEKGRALYVDYGNLVVNGGVVSAHGVEYGIYINKGNLTVNGGTVNATGTTKDIYVSSGTMELVNDNGTWTASFSDSSTETVNIPTNITVDNVSLNRTFTANKAATLMLPFDIDVANTSGAAFYTYTGVTFDTETNKWKATMTQVTSGTIAANTPYVVMPTDAAITFTGSVTLNTTTNSQQTTNGDWTFKGTYEKKTWTADDCGNDYGFAATSGTATDGVTAVQAGDFVKLAAGAWIRPMRAYLTYTGTGNPWASTNAPAHRAATKEMPNRISVILVSANGETTEIDSIENGELRIENSDAWYTLDGRKLDKQPTTKGLYIYNGKKMVIK